LPSLACPTGEVKGPVKRAWVLVVVTVAATACTSAHRTGAGVTATASVPAPTSSSTTSAPSATSPSPSPPAAAAPTVVRKFDPWTASGTPGPNVYVSGKLASATPPSLKPGAPPPNPCFAPSIADPGNQNAWRCSTTAGIYDPCFAPPGQVNVRELLCGRDPWSDFLLLSLSPPLPSSSTGVVPRAAFPWVLILSNGELCQLIQGTGELFDHTVLYYGCDDGYASEPSTTSEPWTVTYVPTSTKTSTSRTVIAAWE
jgi:hypothetical protein